MFLGITETIILVVVGCFISAFSIGFCITCFCPTRRDNVDQPQPQTCTTKVKKAVRRRSKPDRTKLTSKKGSVTKTKTEQMRKHKEVKSESLSNVLKGHDTEKIQEKLIKDCKRTSSKVPSTNYGTNTVGLTSNECGDSSEQVMKNYALDKCEKSVQCDDTFSNTLSMAESCLQEKYDQQGDDFLNKFHRVSPVLREGGGDSCCFHDVANYNHPVINHDNLMRPYSHLFLVPNASVEAPTSEKASYFVLNVPNSEENLQIPSLTTGHETAFTSLRRTTCLPHLGKQQTYPPTYNLWHQMYNGPPLQNENQYQVNVELPENYAYYGTLDCNIQKCKTLHTVSTPLWTQSSYSHSQPQVCAFPTRENNNKFVSITNGRNDGGEFYTGTSNIINQNTPFSVPQENYIFIRNDPSQFPPNQVTELKVLQQPQCPVPPESSRSAPLQHHYSSSPPVVNDFHETRSHTVRGPYPRNEHHPYLHEPDATYDGRHMLNHTSTCSKTTANYKWCNLDTKRQRDISEMECVQTSTPDVNMPMSRMNHNFYQESTLGEKHHECFTEFQPKPISSYYKNEGICTCNYQEWKEDTRNEETSIKDNQYQLRYHLQSTAESRSSSVCKLDSKGPDAQLDTFGRKEQNEPVSYRHSAGHCTMKYKTPKQASQPICNNDYRIDSTCDLRTCVKKQKKCERNAPSYPNNEFVRDRKEIPEYLCDNVSIGETHISRGNIKSYKESDNCSEKKTRSTGKRAYVDNVENRDPSVYKDQVIERQEVPHKTFHKDQQVPHKTCHKNQQVPYKTFHTDQKVPHNTFHKDQQVPHNTFHKDQQVPHKTFHKDQKVPHKTCHKDQKVSHKTFHKHKQVPYNYDCSEKYREPIFENKCQPNIRKYDLEQGMQSDDTQYFNRKENDNRRKTYRTQNGMKVQEQNNRYPGEPSKKNFKMRNREPSSRMECKCNTCSEKSSDSTTDHENIDEALDETFSQPGSVECNTTVGMELKSQTFVKGYARKSDIINTEHEGKNSDRHGFSHSRAVRSPSSCSIDRQEQQHVKHAKGDILTEENECLSCQESEYTHARLQDDMHEIVSTNEDSTMNCNCPVEVQSRLMSPEASMVISGAANECAAKRKAQQTSQTQIYKPHKSLHEPLRNLEEEEKGSMELTCFDISSLLENKIFARNREKYTE